MDVLRRIGLNVVKFRERLGVSQEEFAYLSGIDRTYVSGIERGRRNVAARNLQKIADALGVAPGELFEEINEPTNRRGRGRPPSSKKKKAVPRSRRG